jgi:alkaline phosphatase D
VTAERETRAGHGRLRRRELVFGGAGAGLALAAPINYVALARQRRLPVARGGRFAQGVSSGLPSPKAITLWTRVSELDRTSKLTLEVAEDKQFRDVVERQVVRAEEGRDFTVHARVKGLRPASEYFYRFHTEDRSSRVGRFRTLAPRGSKQPVRIAFYACQSWEAGFYTAQEGIARERDLDLVLCLGDYIYERHFYDGPPERVDTTGVNRDGNVQTLDEYRQKYRLYQGDASLQRMHAAHPFLAVWDDHEVEDNYAGDGVDSAQPDPSLENNDEPRRVPFAERRRNAYKAFFEAMPRLRVKGDRTRIYGSARLGDVAELFFTDQRQYRDPQPCNDALLVPCPENDDPGRTFLGDEQKRWFKRAVARSPARWKLWGSETMVMSLDLPKGHAVNQDQWDGYAAERRDVLEHFLASGVTNLAALTGDIHTFIAGDLSTTGREGGAPIGVELVGGSATSLGIPEALGVPSSALLPLAGPNDPHVKYVDFDRRGYAVVTVTGSKLTCEFKAVETTQSRTSGVSTLATVEVDSGVPAIRVV